jgi:UDP-N-acetylmuramoylalanine--D-glutamate ligase
VKDAPDAYNSLQWEGKRVLVVGMARSGIAAARLLCRLGAIPVLNDAKEASYFAGKTEELKACLCEWHLGEDPLPLLDSCQAVLISPGVPIDAAVVTAACRRSIPVLGELEFASQSARGLMVAVTGTNGKTTTVTLIGEIFKTAGRNAYVTGNVGYPLSAAALNSRENDVLVTEVSSFQLETIHTFHPFAAAVLNITEDHLNRHGTMQAYIALKKRVFENQDGQDLAVLNFDDPACRQMASSLRARVAWFSRKEEVVHGAFVQDGKIILRWNGEDIAVCQTDQVRIPGPHNLENALAAAVITFLCGVPLPAISQALREFAGVEHRIEFVREIQGVRYINDSKGTNVDSTIKAIESMEVPTAIILGGYDKHVSFEPLAQSVCRSGMISWAVLIGQTARSIADALVNAGYTRFSFADTLGDAVHVCQDHIVAGGNVLFSPACASFDMFSDYEARGRIFKEIVGLL